MAMTMEQLISEIEAYPQRLYEALEAVDKTEKAIENLNEQIEEEEASLSAGDEETEEETDDNSEQSGEDIQVTLVKIDHELALLEMRYEQIKGEIELEYRRNPPPGAKVTEATVAAVVKSHPRLVEAKTQCLEKKFERENANLSRRVEYVARVAERRVERDMPPATSPKLEKLREKLETAEVNHTVAEMRLEEVKARLESYQMLTQLYAARRQA